MTKTDWTQKALSRALLPILILTGLPLTSSIVQANEPEFRISRTQYPCNDIERSAGAVMFLRQMGYSPDEVEYRFAEQDRAEILPYIKKAFQYPKVLDDGKSLSEAVRAFSTLELLGCESSISDEKLDPNRHDPRTGKRR